MTERIFVWDQEGALEAIEEAGFPSEDDLQELIAKHPALLDGEQIRPDAPRRWILVGREQGIPETAGEGDWWSLDHLLLDQDGTPTLVEVKRGDNSEIRRKVVGQMLEYAAHAVQNWNIDSLRRSFDESTRSQGLSPQDVLGELLQSDDEPDAIEFWRLVENNLKSANLRLLFVADQIPPSLKRIAEFLNQQMDRVEVLAVEIKQFQGQLVQTLVPRVFGSTGKVTEADVKGPKLTRQEFLDDLPSDASRSAAERLLAVHREKGGIEVWGKSGVTLRVQYSKRREPLTVAWFYPPSKAGSEWMKTRKFTFGEGVTEYDDPNLGEDVRSVLKEWTHQFKEESFTEDVSSKGVVAWSVSYEDIAGNIEVLEKRLAEVVSKLAAL